MKSIISVAIASLIVAALPSMAIADTVRQVYSNRLTSQQARINQGVNNGTISNREFASLSRRQSALNASILRDTQDGNGLTRAERYNLNRRATNISRSIYNYKRN
jgi:hypothetical protein